MTIGNFFVLYSYGQSTLSTIHENSTGLTQSYSCDIVNPALLGIIQSRHLGLSIQPSAYGIRELSHYGICGPLPLDSALFPAHSSTHFMQVDEYSSLQVELAGAWKGQNLPIQLGIKMKYEFVSIDGSPLNPIQCSIGFGSLLNIDDYLRISSCFQTPIVFAGGLRKNDITNPMLIVGCGLAPIDEFAVDVDIVSSAYGSGLRPRCAYFISETTQIHIGFTSLHRSGTIGFSTQIDEMALDAEVFYHLNLGFSWQIALQYCINDLL